MRDSALDNFKFILIALVIVGHITEPLIGKFEWVRSVYVFIYLFHMPMFAYVSGVVSSRKIDDAVIRKIVSKLIIPYVLLEIIYSLFDFVVFSRDSLNISLLIPYWILWYLFSLALWRMLLPIYAQFKFPIALSVLTGLACGLNNFGYNLSFSRTFVFFPFFVIGHYGHALVLEKIQRYRISRFIGCGFIAAVIIVVIVYGNRNLEVGWLYGSRSFSSLGVEWELGVIYRLGLYISAFLLGMAFLSITPKSRGFYTAYGEETFSIYILHGLLMKGLLAAGLYAYIDSEWKAAILILASLVLLPILSSRFCKVIANNMTDPFGSSSKIGLVNAVLARRS